MSKDTNRDPRATRVATINGTRQLINQGNWSIWTGAWPIIEEALANYRERGAHLMYSYSDDDFYLEPVDTLGRADPGVIELPGLVAVGGKCCAESDVLTQLEEKAVYLAELERKQKEVAGEVEKLAGQVQRLRALREGDES
jgi:hypothetical protein